MKKKLNCILLVDDNHDDNVFHQIILKNIDIVNRIDVVLNGVEALAYLKKENQIPPELIFLDINMPRMNGWEFLEQYKHLAAHQKARVVIIILTTSANPDDIKKAKEIEEVTGFETKPLSEKIMTEILNQHFQDYL
jgi:CheY-like chemotaxis protein